MASGAGAGNEVLVCAPYGGDAESLSILLARHGTAAVVCPGMAALAAGIGEATAAVLVTEEALRGDLAALNDALERQPSWSDLPFIVLASRGANRSRELGVLLRHLPPRVVNLMLLERPLSAGSLLSAVASAVRSRQKQFEIRDTIAELDRQKTRLVTLLDHLPVGVAFIGPGLETLLTNPAFRRFQPNGEIPSRSADGEDRWIGFEEDGSRIPRDRFVAVRTLQGETIPGIEFRYRPHTGQDVWTRVSGVPLRNAEGAVEGAITVVVDVDDLKRAQEAAASAAQGLERQVAERTAALESALGQLRQEVAERERAETALRQAQKMEAVGQLTGGIAHDFNNMLTGVLGALDLIRRRIAANRTNDLDRFIQAATTSAQRAAGLTARLLAFARRQSLDSRPTDINALVCSLEDLLHRTMSEQIEVSILPGDAVPQAIVDANQLESAILNLAINARDAMPAGGKLVIETSVATLDDAYARLHPGIKPGRYVVLAISDTGVGMDKAMIEKVFEPFFTTKPVGQGTGLGLSMVYGFARQSSGQVRIHSTPGVGTTVRLYVPVADVAMEAADGPVGPAPPAGDGQTVLLVEDEASVRLLIGEVLQELGYAVVEAAEPESAIRMLQSGRRFDLMISDVGLPGMNGRQLAEIARSHWADLPILFVTGYAENAMVRTGFLGRNMAMIAKPFQIDVLSSKIGEMLAKGRVRSTPEL